MTIIQNDSTDLNTKGMIFLGGEELPIKIKQLSLTRLFAESVNWKKIKSIHDVFL